MSNRNGNGQHLDGQFLAFIEGVTDPILMAQRNRSLEVIAMRMTQNLQARSDRLTTNTPLTLSRDAFMNRGLPDPRRNIPAECGHPETRIITAQDYWDLYDRNPLANRAVEIWPKECWKLYPLVYETDDQDEATAFEDAWDALGNDLTPDAKWFKSERGSPIMQALMRLDILSGIGQFGIMVLGLDDGAPLSEPVKGIKEENSSPVNYEPEKDAEGKQVKDEQGRLKGNWKPPDPKTDPALTVNAKGQLVYKLYKLTWNAEEEDNGKKAGRTGRGNDQRAMDTTGLGTPKGPPGEGDANGRNPDSVEGKAEGEEEAFTPRFKLRYLRCFAEHQILITQFETNKTSDRYCMPLMYQVDFSDVKNQQGGIGLPSGTEMVHWTRVIHVADFWHTAASGTETFAVQRLRPLINDCLDAYKVSGIDAEGYYGSAYPGHQFVTHHELGGDVDVDLDALRDAYENYKNDSSQRAMLGRGGEWKPMAPTVAEPTAHWELHAKNIAVKQDIAWRIWMGSERGELASSQDEKQHVVKCKNRRDTHCTPSILQPFIGRSILLGLLPEPEQVIIEWPDEEGLGEVDKATVANTRTTAMSAYLAGGVEALMTPLDYLTRELGYTEDEAAAILQNAQKEQMLEEFSSPEPPPLAVPGQPGQPPPFGGPPGAQGGVPGKPPPMKGQPPAPAGSFPAKAIGPPKSKPFPPRPSVNAFPDSFKVKEEKPDDAKANPFVAKAGEDSTDPTAPDAPEDKSSADAFKSKIAKALAADDPDLEAEVELLLSGVMERLSAGLTPEQMKAVRFGIKHGPKSFGHFCRALDGLGKEDGTNDGSNQAPPKAKGAPSQLGQAPPGAPPFGGPPKPGFPLKPGAKPNPFAANAFPPEEDDDVKDQAGQPQDRADDTPMEPAQPEGEGLDAPEAEAGDAQDAGQGADAKAVYLKQLEQVVKRLEDPEEAAEFLDIVRDVADLMAAGEGDIELSEEADDQEHSDGQAQEGDVPVDGEQGAAEEAAPAGPSSEHEEHHKEVMGPDGSVQSEHTVKRSSNPGQLIANANPEGCNQYTGPECSNLPGKVSMADEAVKDRWVKHHHWAAIVGKGSAKDKDYKLPVYRIDTDIGTALHMANAYASAVGIAPKSVPKTNAQPTDNDAMGGDCGTGAGGFQEGNTCGKGDGSGTTEKQTIVGSVKAKLGNIGTRTYNAMPKPVQQAVDAGTWVHHQLEGGYKAGQALAHAVAKEKGLTDFEANRAAKMLAVADGVTRWAGNWKVAEAILAPIGGPVGIAGAIAVGKLSYYVPVASLAYVGFHAASELAQGRNPAALISRARERVRQARASTPTVHAYFTHEEDLPLMMEFLGEGADLWKEALLSAALDEAHGDLGVALELAGAAAEGGE